MTTTEVTWEQVVQRAHDWYEAKYPEDDLGELTEIGVALAVAKPIEERGELLGSYIKWRRMKLLDDPREAVFWADVLNELADEIITPMMTARALRISPAFLLEVVDSKLAELEARTPGEGGHA